MFLQFVLKYKAWILLAIVVVVALSAYAVMKARLSIKDVQIAHQGATISEQKTTIGNQREMIDEQILNITNLKLNQQRFEANAKTGSAIQAKIDALDEKYRKETIYDQVIVRDIFNGIGNGVLRNPVPVQPKPDVPK